jgi:hypothetical protein
MTCHSVVASIRTLRVAGVIQADASSRLFVAVRRTSRPGQTQPRALGVLIEGDEPVLVENHCWFADPSTSGRLVVSFSAYSVMPRPAHGSIPGSDVGI